MLKRTLLSAALGLSLVAGATHAASTDNVQVSLSYGVMDAEQSGFDIETDLAIASVGYRYDIVDTDFTLVPEFSLGTGIGDYEINDVDTGINIDRLIILSLRAEYAATDSLSVFVRPSYVNTDIGVEDDWEFGYGIGLDNTYRNGITIGVAYDKVDDSDILSANLRYQF
jgi:hypothetical protein